MSPNLFFILSSIRRSGVTGSDWKFLKNPLWVHSGEELGDLEKVMGDQYEAGCGVGPEERSLEWVVTMRTKEGARLERGVER